MDSITLPERSRHEGPGRPIRRRRSAAHSPVVLAPIDIPEDAEGRVEIFAVHAPEDAAEAPPLAVAAAPGDGEAEPPEAGAERSDSGAAEVLAFGPAAPPTGERASWSEALLALHSGWVAVLVLAAILLALFVLGDLLTH